MKGFTAFAAGALATLAVLFPVPTQAAEGVDLIQGVERLDGPYVVRFAGEDSREKMARWLRRPVQQLRDAGLDIRIGGTGPSACMDGTVYVMQMYRPLQGKPGYSRAYPCKRDGVVAGGALLMNSEYKELGGTWESPEWLVRNGFAHELGHALGLDHPKCTKERLQVMCSPNGGYRDHRAGYYTPADLAGFTHLLRK